LRRSLAAIFAGSTLCLAQQPPTFRAGTTLIEFSVTAVDRKGGAVADLSANEIRITENGRSRSVAVFRYDGGAAGSKPAALPPGVVTNRAEYTAGPPRNVIAILLDALNTPAADQMSARDQVLSRLSTIEPGTRVAVYRLAGGLTTLHDFTVDAASLKARIEEAFRKMPAFVSPDVSDLECFSGHFRTISSSQGCEGKIKMFLMNDERQASVESLYYEAQASRRVADTMAALETLGDHLSGIPGRKSLLWIGGGVPMQSITGVQRLGNIHSGFQSFEAQVRKTARHLASRGIVVYPVDSLGGSRSMSRPLPDPRSRGALNVMANLVSMYQPESTHDAFAQLTGGRVIRLTNDLASGVSIATADQRASYTLGFYADQDPDGKWHSVEVKTTRPGVKLSNRQGYMAEGAEQPAEWTEERWRREIVNPVGSTAIRLDARLVPAAGGQQSLLLQIEATDLVFRDPDKAVVEVAIVEKAADGSFDFKARTTEIKRPANGQGVVYGRQCQLEAGTATLRLIVRDKRTGRQGSLDLPVVR
jgi:VWFA-related protein